MTEVFFYHGAADKVAAACSLLGKAAVQKKRIVVFAPQADLASQIDRVLWTQQALGFYPHCRIDSPLAPETPILLADRLDEVPADIGRLFNMSLEVPPGLDRILERFPSLIEVVGQEDADRLAARERVGIYKARGCEIRYFDLSQQG